MGDFMTDKKEFLTSAYDFDSDSNYENDDFPDNVIDEEAKTEKELEQVLNDDSFFATNKKGKRTFLKDEEARKLVAQYQALRNKKIKEGGLSYMEEWTFGDIFKELEDDFHGIIGTGVEQGLKRFKITDVTYHRDNILTGSINGLQKALINFNLDQDKVTFSTYLCSCVRNEVSGELKKTFGSKNNDISFQTRINGDEDSGQYDELGSFVCDNGAEELANERIIIEEYECKYAPRFLRLLTKEERAVWVFRKGLFGVQPVNQEDLARFLSMAQPTISNNQKNAQDKFAEYVKKHPDFFEMHKEYFEIMNNNTTRFRSNNNLAPYQAHHLERRRTAQELYDQGLDLEEISREANIKMKELTSLVPRFEKGEFRFNFSIKN